eukprot:Nitzschia sp. Nitz4//scaffold27_size158506//6362//9106//NITZ4_002576-RA/size158506-processed-gene-0.0-mRNA-1//1//CDS//3329545416//1917//frame0
MLSFYQDDDGRHWALDVQVQDSPMEDGESLFDSLRRRLFDNFIGEESQDPNNNSTLHTPNVTTTFSNDTFDETSINTEVDADETQVFTNNDTSSAFQPIRIKALMTEDQKNWLNASELEALFDDMLPPALLAWGQTLRVDPVVGNLTVDPTQLADGETCGPGKDSGMPSFPVPLSHIHPGVPDKDVVVYLSLSFVEPRIYNESTVDDGLYANATDDQTPVDDDEYRETVDENGRDLGFLANNTFGGLVDKTQTTGDMDTDSSTDTSTPFNATTSPVCTGEYLASSSFCNTDQYDRPTAALLHICIDANFFEPSKLERNILTLMHELGHALGFNSLSMAHFRRLDGTPYTRRVNGQVPDVTIECTGTESERHWSTVPLPSTEVLQFREERGIRVAQVVTPSVLQAVRNHFDCQNLTGAELESGESLASGTPDHDLGCIGDHWERRLFSGDIMNPVVDELDGVYRVSPLTLAYFADSGWYQVDLSGARLASVWGRGAGCPFVTENCISSSGDVPPQNAAFFCNEIPSAATRSEATEIRGCTSDLSRKAICSMGHYDLELPWEYQYFQATYGSDVGGNDPLMDYCPVYLGYDNGLCTSQETRTFMQASSVETFGQRNSRCVMGKVGRRATTTTALCLPIACVIEDQSLRVRIDDTWHRCEEVDQIIGDEDVLISCPDSRRVCPTFFCPYDCLGTNGICDYGSGQCVCEYQESLVDGEPTKGPCGSVLDVETGSIILEEDDTVVPYPDSPYADYYVPTERELEGGDPGVLEPWAIVVVCVSGICLIALIAVLSLRLRSDWEPSSEWFSRPLPEEPQPTTSTQRNKDKMIATVLVDMRIHSRPSQDQESLAATAENMTESEASANEKCESLSEVSSRRSELSDAGSSTGAAEVVDDSLPEPQVIRRRRVALDYSNSNNI